MSTPEVTKGYHAAWLERSFPTLIASLNGAKSHPFHEARLAAYKMLLEQGLPSPKREEWRYTDLAQIAKGDFKIGPVHVATGVQSEQQEAITAVVATLPELPRVVLINGVYNAQFSKFSSVAGLEVKPLSHLFHDKAQSIAGKDSVRDVSEGKDEHKSFPLQLNTAFVSDGVVIEVKKGAQISEPLLIVSITVGNGSFSAPRVVVRLEASSTLATLELHCGVGEVLLSVPVTEVELQHGAILNHTKVIQFPEHRAHNLGAVTAAIAGGAHFHSHTITLGGSVVRNEVVPTLLGEDGSCTMSGLSLLRGKAHVDNYTVLDHAAPRCESSELFKGVYSDDASAAFCGTIIVRKDAQKTNAFQSNQTILLSDRASINSKPQLKIWADDVKCTHGATVGQLDKDALFYIESRGIGTQDAKRILVAAFASEVVSLIKNEQVRGYVGGLVESALQQMAQ